MPFYVAPKVLHDSQTISIMLWNTVDFSDLDHESQYSQRWERACDFYCSSLLGFPDLSDIMLLMWLWQTAILGKIHCYPKRWH